MSNFRYQTMPDIHTYIKTQGKRSMKRGNNVIKQIIEFNSERSPKF